MKQKVLSWLQAFNTFCFLDNHQYHISPQVLECLAGAGVRRKIEAPAGNALARLQHFVDEQKAWLFGHLGYDLKNETEQASSRHPDTIGFPDLFFFEPEILVRLNETGLTIDADEPQSVFAQIISTKIAVEPMKAAALRVRGRIDKVEYIRIIERLQQHILRGDCYEINFCQEFFADAAVINPLLVYQLLTKISPNPFSALYRLENRWLLCASPERFLLRKGNQVISQPIKGTSTRQINDSSADEQNRQMLAASAKDRSENVMIVDLVRNDLSKICEEGSVHVDELYGIYSFPQVHQMISTISGSLRNDVTISDMLRATFPMGSMTGAPKKIVVELIEKYEKTRRGIFSGALGYIKPDQDFDFNVVIRSIMYNDATSKLCYLAGSGITFYSDPEKEWEECNMKAAAIQKVLMH